MGYFNHSAFHEVLQRSHETCSYRILDRAFENRVFDVEIADTNVQAVSWVKLRTGDVIRAAA